ncbi:hypothetical protein ACHAXS_007258 [Conticribra weissflogii]
MPPLVSVAFAVAFAVALDPLFASIAKSSMLIKEDSMPKTGNDDEGSGVWSLVSNTSNRRNDINSNDEPSGVSVAGLPTEKQEVNTAKIEDATSGVLIVEGEDDNTNSNVSSSSKVDDCEDAAEEERGLTLSVPDTVFLPSDIGSLEAKLHESGEFERLQENSKRENDRGTKEEQAWPKLVSQLHDDIQGCSGSTKKILLVVVFALMAAVFCTAWIYRSWKYDVLQRTNADMRKQVSSLQLVALMSREMMTLKNKIAVLEEEIDVLTSSCSNDNPSQELYEDLFSMNDPHDEDAFMLLNNCYVRASLSLGQCSREWQYWWNNNKTDEGDSTGHGSDAEGKTKSTGEDYPSQMVTAINDISRFVEGMFDRVTDKSLDAYSFVENNIKDMSYKGVDGVLLLSKVMQELVNITSETLNDATEPRPKLSARINKSDAKDGISKFMYIAKSAIKDGTNYAKEVEKVAFNSFLSVYEYTSSLIENVSTSITDDYLLVNSEE